MHSLVLSASAGTWRLFAARKADPAFQQYCQRVWERDSYTCQFCGFQAKQFQEVINLDGNYQNNKFPNMVTSCCFCTQCLFLEIVGKTDYGGGTLIYLSELAQPDLNGLCHVLFCAIANATNYHTDAQAIYRSFKARAKTVEEQLGEGMSNPALLGQVLIDAQLKNKTAFSQELLKDLRLLPSRSKFSAQIETWANAALNEMAG